MSVSKMLAGLGIRVAALWITLAPGALSARPTDAEDVCKYNCDRAWLTGIADNVWMRSRNTIPRSSLLHRMAEIRETGKVLKVGEEIQATWIQPLQQLSAPL